MRSSFTWIVALGMTFSGLSTFIRANDTDILTGLAERMTREALDAGAIGDEQLRTSLLEKAVHVAPDYAPAHWAQGQVAADGAWVSIGELQAAAREDERLSKYQKLRSSAKTPAQHCEVARYCRQNDLADEGRYHWLCVLAADPDNREALAALDSVWFDGELVSPAEASKLRDARSGQRKIDGEWKTRIAAWQRALKSGGGEAESALVELASTVDESAITAFEKLAAGKRGVTSAEAARSEQLSLAFIDALANMPSYEATESLVRFAVLAPDESLRTAASEKLAERPLHETMPLLISRLSSLIETRFDIRVSPTGRVSYDHEMFTEGPEGDEVAEVARTGGAVVTFGQGQTAASILAGRARGRAVAARHLRQFQREAAVREQQTAATNAHREAVNARVVSVLEAATGEVFGNDPQAWWDYWYDHNGYESRSSQPAEVYRTSTSQLMEIYIESQPDRPSRPSTRSTPQDPPTGGRRCECFAAGTPVWTKTGMQAIETLEAGDLVLGMDAETGERCFRPVLATTVRPPSPLMRISAGNYDLRATAGHPFWVAGQGWRMAKELAPGDRVLTAEGLPLEVFQVTAPDEESDEPEEAYNLIVEGTGNYFVGQEGLLSHDNTPRRADQVRLGER